MKNYNQFLNEARTAPERYAISMAKSKKETRPYLSIPNSPEYVVITDDVLFMTADEIFKKYNTTFINAYNVDYKYFIKFIENNFNKLKMNIDIFPNWITSNFEKNGKKSGFEMTLGKTYINISWLGHKYMLPSGLSHIRTFIVPFMRYLTRDCRSQLEQFFEWTKTDVDMMIESEIMDSMKDYDVQKGLYDMGYIALIRKIGINKKLSSEIQNLADIEDQSDLSFN